MKPLPAPQVPGHTDAERMSNALNMVLKISKADLLKKEAGLNRRAKGNRRKRPAKNPMPDLDVKTLLEILIVVVAFFGYLACRSLSRIADTVAWI